MRTIKFRAWDEDLGMSYCPVSIDFNSDGTLRGVAIFQSGLQVEIRGNNSMVWMQSTGLKDKAGKEIYEGDILQMYFRNNQKAGTPFPVAWNDKHAAFTDWWPREGVEVIGNIYENPSLLD